MVHIQKTNAVALKVSLMLALLLLSGSYAIAHGNGDGHDEADVDATCMQTAIEVREDALISAWEDFNTTIASALAARKTALKDAWGLSDNKALRKATVAAWKDWKTESKEAHKALKSEKKFVWSTFKETAKETCGMSVPKDEALGKDAAGSIAL